MGAAGVEKSARMITVSEALWTAQLLKCVVDRFAPPPKENEQQKQSEAVLIS